jgi:hypothetical protein
MNNDNPGQYRYSDQLARFEAARTYMAAAVKILQDAQEYERRNSLMDVRFSVHLDAMLDPAARAFGEIELGIEDVSVYATAEEAMDAEYIIESEK